MQLCLKKGYCFNVTKVQATILDNFFFRHVEIIFRLVFQSCQIFFLTIFFDMSFQAGNVTCETGCILVHKACSNTKIVIIISIYNHLFVIKYSQYLYIMRNMYSYNIAIHIQMLISHINIRSQLTLPTDRNSVLWRDTNSY